MRGTLWTVPTEVARALAMPVGINALTKAALEHSVFRPHAEIEAARDHFVATVWFDSPRYPGLIQSVSFAISAPLLENRAGGAT